jgi:hypothetical protein
MAGICHFFQRLRVNYAQFRRCIKYTRGLLKYTHLNSFGVHFGIRLNPFRNR